jgi:hypothetical protein
MLKMSAHARAVHDALDTLRASNAAVALTLEGYRHLSVTPFS